MSSRLVGIARSTRSTISLLTPPPLPLSASTHSKPVRPSFFSCTRPLLCESFHSRASVLEAGIAFVCIFTMPIHPYALLAFQTASFLINVYGHLGYEFSQYRTTVYSVWSPLRYINRTCHHHDHHKRCVPPCLCRISSGVASHRAVVQRRRMQERQLWAVHDSLGPSVFDDAASSPCLEIKRLNAPRQL
jgi:hypothetical protein